jgi:hypothetical protein
MERYAYLIAAVGLGILYLGAIYLYQRRRSQAGTGHSWLSYVLVWPLILDADRAKREGRFLTKREWLGWGLVVLIVIVAIVLTPNRGAG